MSWRLDNQKKLKVINKQFKQALSKVKVKLKLILQKFK